MPEDLIYLSSIRRTVNLQNVMSCQRITSTPHTEKKIIHKQLIIVNQQSPLLSTTDLVAATTGT